MSNPVIANIILEGAATVEDTLITDGNGKRVEAEGTLQDMDVENRNRRIYAKSDLVPEINGPRMTELIKAKQFCGEYGHPLSDDLVRQQTIDPKLVCVRFNKVWVEDNLVKARFQGTNNDYGEYFDRDLRDGCKPAFSLRALGAIENVNGKAYVKGIKIITWDSVIYPSHKVAYTSNIVTESAMDGTPLYENQIIVPKDDPGTIITLRESDARTVINRLQRESANMDLILNTFDGIYDKISLVNENTIMLTNAMGGKISVNLENHVQNLIMDYVSKY
jgi:hypothetical protein